MYVTRKFNATVVAAKLERLTRLGFTEAEPLGYVDGANLYEYVGGSPLNHTDAVGTQMAPLNPQSPQMAPPTIELPGRVDPLSIPHTPLEMMFGPRSSFMLPSTHVTGDPGRVPRPDPQRDPEGARIWDAEAGGVLKDVLAEVKRFDDYLLSLETVNSDCWWKCFDGYSSSTLFHVPFLGGGAGAGAAALTTPFPKPLGAIPKGSGLTNLSHLIFGSNLLKRPFAKQIGLRAAVTLGKFSTKAIPVAGWALLAWDAAAAAYCTDKCRECK